jgi:TPR repeat protein
MKLSTTAALSAFAAFAAFSGAEAASQPAGDPIGPFLTARSAESPKRYRKAAKAVAAEAAAGKPLHQFVLAVVSREKDAPEEARLDEETRNRYLEGNRTKIYNLAQLKDNPLAWYLLSLEKGDENMLRRAADGDNVQALNDIGTRKMTRALAGNRASDRVQAEMREAFGYFNRAAGKNDPNGLYNLGTCYLNGFGCKKDASVALDFLRRAADAEQPKAVNAIGEMYRDGVAVERDRVAATKYFSESASLGYANGQYNYGLALKNGDGIEKNMKRATSYMKLAADQGFVPAMDEYAQCLWNGAGVEPPSTNGLYGAELDLLLASAAAAETNRMETAAVWWNQCARAVGYPPSMYHLAECYLTGRGAAVNERMAVVWLMKAARANYVPAMERLADCCEKGIGGLKESHYNANWWRTRARYVQGDRNASVWLSTHRLEDWR